MTVTVTTSGITFPGGTQSSPWPGNAGTVTSVATGNGLSGGTITSTGTLVVACPTHNTIGSYAFGYTGTVTNFGSNLAGSGITITSVHAPLGCPGYAWVSGGPNPTGTWKCMGYCDGSYAAAVWCRVS